MPDYPDDFRKMLLGRIDFNIKFFRFLLNEKSEFFEPEKLILSKKSFTKKVVTVRHSL